VYFVQEQALGKRRRLEKFITATAEGWNAAYTDYNRTVPIIANAINAPLSPSLIAWLMDAQHVTCVPMAQGLVSWTRGNIRVLQAQLLQRRDQEPVDLTRAVNYDVLKAAYRSAASNLNRDEP
jgi:hypothetical protein